MNSILSRLIKKVPSLLGLTLTRGVYFLQLISNSGTFPHAKLAVMNKTYDLDHAKNAEVQFRWEILCLENALEDIFPFVAKFLSEQGRMKYIRPLYRYLL